MHNNMGDQADELMALVGYNDIPKMEYAIERLFDDFLKNF